MAEPTDMGMNRTGMDVSPVHAKNLTEISHCVEKDRPAERSALGQMRERYIRESDPIGSVPPPGSMKGAAVSAGESLLKGHKPTVFIDKLGERLAFERTGVRLYDAIITKFDVQGSWEGGPARQDLEQIREEELRHFHLIHDAVEKLGADPTAMTPAADVVGVASSGVLKVITDPRTTMPQSLQALLIAERADIDGWTMLIELAGEMGQDTLQKQFREAHEAEERHAVQVQQWLSKATSLDVKRDLQ